MTNLTELLKKGELPNGWYYVRLIRGEHRIDLYINSKNEWIDCPDNIIDTVVCEVPSYEEYQKLLSDQLAKIEGEEINAELEAKIKEKETQRIKLMLKLNDVNNDNHSLRIENAKLKELLKEVNDYLPEFEMPMTILAKIDEVLK